MTRRILVVEDSRTQAERLRLLLTRAGYEVMVALNGQQGLDQVRLAQPDLILSDITMPGMNGFDLCRTVRSSEGTRRIPFILLTARSSPTDIITGLECGADNFLPKPYEDEHLLERIRRILEQLEYRKREPLDMEVHLTVAGRRISVTADRQQIMELLFSTIEEVSRNHDALVRANRELQEVRAEVERANQATFLSRMSHELRTPLNAVIGFAQLLEMGGLDPRQQDSAHRIVEAGQHLLNLINDVLDIGRIDAGELPVSLEPVSIGDVLAEAVCLLQPLAAERSVELDGHGSCALRVMADRQRLKQVILNLLSNAITYNHRGGMVTFSCRDGGEGRRRIEVTDTGRGIAAENLHRLFMPFDRLGAERDTTVGGTGLGLVLSRRLVEAMGGTLGVESTLGAGSTFWVELPAAEDRRGEVETERALGGSRARPPRETRQAATLLYIEDSASNLALVERILVHRPGIRLMAASEGRRGLSLAREHRPDMILLDLCLPDMSGEEVLTELRAAPETSAIPVLVVTADASVARPERSRSLRTTGHLTKPFDVSRFLQAVDETLAVHQHLG